MFIVYVVSRVRHFIYYLYSIFVFFFVSCMAALYIISKLGSLGRLWLIRCLLGRVGNSLPE